MTQFLIFLFFFLNLFSTANESEYPQYTWPVLSEKIVTGSFGEFRPFSFHMGQDFGTEAKNGIPILAITNAKVYKIQSYRYSIGNAIILEHDDGYFSRYGHLNNFSEKIWDNIKDQTILGKRKRRLDFEYILSKEEQTYFKQGDMIAYSGETGIGPSHLHLEIFKNNIYYNPADFGLNFHSKGEISIFGVDIIPENSNSFINGKNQILHLKVQRDKNFKWKINSSNNIKIKGMVSISFYGNEGSGPSNKIGFQKIGIYLNGQELQEFNFHQISSLHTQRLNFIIDPYKSRMNGRPFKYFTHSKEGNNLLGTKILKPNAGKINSKDLLPNTNEILITLKGISKDTNYLMIPIEEDINEYPLNAEPNPNVKSDSYTTLSSEDKQLELFFPSYSVFTPENFKIEKKIININPITGMKLESNAYEISPDFREFNIGYDLYFKLDKEINPEKFGLYQIYNNARSFRYLQPSLLNLSEKFFRIRLKNTGSFAILSDNSKPTIRIHHFKSGHIFRNSDFKLYLILSDIGTGIFEPSLNIKVDEEEVYNDLNPETGLRELFHPETLKSKGKHTIKATAKDKALNDATPFIFEYTVL
jgi:hypothetical protein